MTAPDARSLRPVGADPFDHALRIGSSSAAYEAECAERDRLAALLAATPASGLRADETELLASVMRERFRKMGVPLSEWSNGMYRYEAAELLDRLRQRGAALAAAPATLPAIDALDVFRFAVSFATHGGDVHADCGSCDALAVRARAAYVDVGAES